MLLFFLFALVVFYFVHPALFWLWLSVLAVMWLHHLVETAYSLDDDHGGICRACVLREEDFYSRHSQKLDTVFYTVRLSYRDGACRRVTLREDDALLQNLCRRGLLHLT